MDLDNKDYKWAIVGEPCRRFAWILSREESMPESEVKEKLKFLESKGYTYEDYIFRGSAEPGEMPK